MRSPGLFVSCTVVIAAWAVGCTKPAVAPLKEAKPPTVIVQPVVEEDIREFDEYTGRLQATDTVEVRSRVRGHLVEVNFTDGSLVKAGDVLFRIDDRTYKATYDQAAARKAAALAQKQLADSEFERAKLLLEKKAASQQDIDFAAAKKAVADADVLKAEADLQAEQLNLDFTVIHAEIDGRTSRPLATKGNLVNAGGGDTLLTYVVSLDPIYVYFDVDENALQHYAAESRAAGVTKMERIKDAKIPVFVALGTDEGFPHEGIIDFVENRVDPSTGTIKVRGLLPNTDGSLLPGYYAKVRVYSATKAYRGVRVPDRAIATDLGVKYVLVVNADNVVERRRVDPGPLQDGRRIIKTGLLGGERIIVSGLQRARPGGKVTPEEETVVKAETAARD